MPVPDVLECCMAKRVLVYCGDRWHPPADAMVALGNLESSGYHFQQAASEEELDDLSPLDIVVLAKLNVKSELDETPWLTTEGESALVKFVYGGGALFIVHAGSAGYERLPELRTLRGGAFLHHPPIGPVTIYPVAGEALAAGLGQISLKDEHYHMEVDPGMDIFLTTRSTHGTQPAGWTRSFGFGRVCVVTPGHTAEVWANPEFLEIVKRGLDWVSAPARNSALVTGADRGLGLALCEALLQRNWNVLAGQYMPDWPELANLKAAWPDTLHILPLDVGSDASAQKAAQLAADLTQSIDLLISNAGVMAPDYQSTIREHPSFANMNAELNVNAVGPLRVVDAFLPLLDRGATKTLCFVSSEAGSISQSTRVSWYGYCMSKAALNIAAKNLENLLKADGYIINVYHPGYVRGYMHGTKNLEAYLEPDEAAQSALNAFLAPPAEGPLTLLDWEGGSLPW